MTPTPHLRAAAAIVFVFGLQSTASARDLDASDQASAQSATQSPAQSPAQSTFRAWALALRSPSVTSESTGSVAAGTSARETLATSTTDRATDLVVRALALIGVHYRRGGNAPDTGFDCSGMVRYVYHNAFGLDLPRRAEDISRVGEHIGRNELQPGDLVFYNTLRRTFSHVGIYLGDNRFIHAPASGGAVRVEDMDQAYWVHRFSGARRVAE